MSSGKCKLKQQWDITGHLLECPKPRTLTTTNADEDVEQQELSFIAGGNVKWCSHFGRQYDNFLQNLNILLLYNSCAPWYFPKGCENLCPHQNLYTDVHSSFIHHC